MLCKEGKISLYSFAGTFIIIFLLLIPQIYFNIVPNIWSTIFLSELLVFYILINIFLRLLFDGIYYQIAIRASLLGFILISGLLVVFNATTTWKSFGIYWSFMAIFHYTEFLAIAWSNPRALSTDSFILNHSPQYAIAAVTSWSEFLIEAYLCPEIKQYYMFWILGTVLCSFGELMRKLAMITAKSNFNHLVQYVKVENHKLVTHGIYSVVRHPSYVGWFWWSIGTQIILFNPLCILLYALVSWKFFNDRIYLEEITLLKFFGTDYCEYQKRVPTGLPLINGYQIETKLTR